MVANLLLDVHEISSDSLQLSCAPCHLELMGEFGSPTKE